MKMKNVTLKKTQSKSWLIIAMILFLCICSNNTSFVYATADTTNLGISAHINPRCTFKTGGVSVSFGNYEPITTHLLLPNLSSGDFDVKCTKNSTAQIAMDAGLNPTNALLTTRAMTDGNGNYLSYEIFSDAARSLIWSITNTVSYTDLGGAATSIPVFAIIPPAQNVSAGYYSDTVTISISY